MEDYEKANAREWDLHSKETKKAEASSSTWQVVSSSKKPEKPPQRSSPQKWQNAAGAVRDTQPKRPPPRFIMDPENQAHQSWRNREAPKASVRIPGELVLQDKTHTTIAAHHGAFIFSETPKSNYGTMTYGIWGDGDAVEATKRAISAWIEDFMASKKSGRVAKFAKIQSLTPGLWERAEKKWKKEVKKYCFRQFPPPEMAFGAIGSFHWPVKEYRPEEILGMSYEALDPIRVDSSCYVVFRKDRGIFQVMGKADNVRAGLLRLRGTCFQIAARQITPLRLYLLYWPDATNLPTHVYLEPYEYPTVLSGDGPTDAKTGWSPRGDGSDPDNTRSEAQTGLSEERVRTSVLQTLSKLHYYNGSIQMRVRLGTFLATQYRQAKDGLYELDEYESMLGASQFIGHVTQELGNKPVEQAALATLHNADGLLSPQDAMTKDLADVKPVYSAILTFADEVGDLRLTICWEEAQDTSSKSTAFEIVSTKWTRLERDTAAVSSILDISLNNLNTGKAFNFEVSAAQAVDESRLPNALMDFAQSVSIDANEARKANTDKSFIKIKRYAPHLKSIQLRISYRYYIASSDYTLELTRFQNRTYPPRKSAFLPAAEPTVYEPRWGLSVYRIEWDTMFTKNARLPIGERADWSHDVDTWFPADFSGGEDEESKGVGFGQLMEKLKAVGKLVMEAKEEDLMTDLVGGMTVG